MDLFRRNNSNEATKLDHYDSRICKRARSHRKDDKMLRKLARTRLKQQIKNECTYDEELI